MVIESLNIHTNMLMWKYACKQVAYKRRDPMRTKIVIDNKIIENINLFNYLGNMVSYEGELDIDNKLNRFLKITGILNNVF